MKLRVIRLLSAFLVAVLCLGVFAACDNSDDDFKEINSALADALEDIEALNKANLEASEAIAELEQANVDAQQRIDALTDANEKIDSLNQALESDKNRLEDLVNRVNSGFEDLSEELASYNDAMHLSAPYIYVGGEEVNAGNYLDVLNDGGSIFYNPLTKILTLQDVELSIEEGFILATDDLTINLVGENNITVNGGTSERAYGIICSNNNDSKDLCFCGDGSLNIEVVTGEDTVTAIGLLSDEMIFCCSNVDVTVGNALEDSRALECGDLKTFESSISLASGDADSSAGIYAYGSVLINPETVIDVKSGVANDGYGAYVQGNLYVYRADVTIKASAGEGAFYDVLCHGSVQIYNAKTFNVNTLEAIDGVWNNEGFPNESIERIRIYIDQGHNPSSYHNAGAEGNGLYEQDLTYKVGVLLADLLRADGRFEIMLSRPTPTTVLGTDNSSSLDARVQGAKDFEADYFISIHANAFTQDSATGAEVWVAATETESHTFATALLGEMVKSTGLNNRGVKVNSELKVLKNATMPAALVEMGFITNPTDAALMDQHPELFATGLYNGILSYFEFNSVSE